MHLKRDHRLLAVCDHGKEAAVTNVSQKSCEIGALEAVRRLVVHELVRAPRAVCEQHVVQSRLLLLLS